MEKKDYEHLAGYGQEGWGESGTYSLREKRNVNMNDRIIFLYSVCSFYRRCLYVKA